MTELISKCQAVKTLYIRPDQLDFLLLTPGGSFFEGGVDLKNSAHARVLNVNL